MDVAIYCRISSDREMRSESPERQESLCRQLVEAKGWNVREVFVDRNLSAWNKRKALPALARMWEGLETGQFGAVCVLKMDRLLRRFSDLGGVLKRLQDVGAELLSVTEHLDTTTPMGQAIIGFTVAQAQTESDNASFG